jgi:L-amino acid N-acyltransferase YncA
MIPVQCYEARHAGAILDILNDAIANSTALYDYHPRTAQNMADWFETKRAKGYPVIGFEDTDGALMGFASYGTFRAYPAYKYTVEHSVYVHPAFRRKGVARALMTELIAHAQAQDFHVLIGAIDADNAASIALHQALGFHNAGLIRQAGFKFGRWLDLCFMQRVLATPDLPVDG